MTSFLVNAADEDKCYYHSSMDDLLSIDAISKDNLCLFEEDDNKENLCHAC